MNFMAYINVWEMIFQLIQFVYDLYFILLKTYIIRSGCYIWYQNFVFQNDFWELWGVSLSCFACETILLLLTAKFWLYES